MKNMVLAFLLTWLVFAFSAATAEAKHRPQPELVRKERIIRAVFGRTYGHDAVKVAKCESGPSLDLQAKNGQYRGMFQMGRRERAVYGHGRTALAQARAAHRYFMASGSNWGPWACKPWF